MLRSIPKVDEVLAQPQVKKAMEEGRSQVTDGVRQVLDGLREQILRGEEPDLSLEGVSRAVLQQVEENSRMSLRPVINGTGIVLHTNLGRAVMCHEAAQAAMDVAENYNTLEYDCEKGRRGSRYSHVEDLICRLTGAEAALVVNNNAAAVMLVLGTMAKNKQLIVSRGELVEIGGSFRVPEIMARSGAQLVEVGTTNKTRPADYAAALDAGEAQVLLKVHPSNFRVVGFTQAVSLPELGALARKRGVPLFCDLGSAAPGSPELAEAVAWADVCCFSGDKLLGGPQAGILLGKAEQLGRLRADPLFRALRPGKLALAALEATLLDWRDGTAVPVSAMLSAPPEELRRRAEALAEALSPLHPCTAVETQGEVGGGARPGESLPAWAAALEPAEALEAHLRAWRVPILGRIHRGKLLLDVRTLLPGDEAEIAAALAAWREERA